MDVALPHFVKDGHFDDDVIEVLITESMGY